jgi:predicted membrane protein
MIDEKQERRRGPIVVGVHLGNRSYGGGLLWGVLITLVGVALLLDHMGIINVDHFWRFWPLILVVAGIANLSCRESRLWGIILVLGGVLLQLNQLGLASFSWAVIWPIALIAVGVLVMWGSLESRNKPATTTRFSGDPRTTLNETVVFGGIERKVTTQDFQGGQVNAVFGGVELDLREANMQGDDATLELNALFGGVDLRLPESWQVAFRGTPIFGGISDKSRTARLENPENAKSKVLFLTGAVIFGGVDIKN